MGLSAVAIPSNPKFPFLVFGLSFDGSYPTGGYPLDVEKIARPLFGASVSPTFLSVFFETDLQGRLYAYDRVGKRVKIIDASGVEMGHDSNLVSVQTRMTVLVSF